MKCEHASLKMGRCIKITDEKRIKCVNYKPRDLVIICCLTIKFVMEEICLRWGFFGAGQCTHDFINALKLSPPEHHQIKAIAARKLTKAQEFAEKMSVPKAYGSYKELAECPEVDIIYIGTVNSEHFYQAKLALQNSKHVLCEKPVCINKAQAQELVDLANKNNLFFMEGFWTFFFPATRKLLEEVKKGTVGKVIHMTVLIGNKFEHLDRFSRKDIGGGTLLNHGVYGIMFAYQLFGKPTKISASGMISESGTDQSATVTLSYKDGQMATIVCSCKANMPGELKVIGSEGTIKLHFPFWAPTKLEICGQLFSFPLPEPAKEMSFNNLNSPGFVYEIEAVRQCIVEGRKFSDIVSWDASLSVMGIADIVLNQVFQEDLQQERNCQSPYQNGVNGQ